LKNDARARKRGAPDSGFGPPDGHEIDASAASQADNTELSSADRALVKRVGAKWAVLSSLWPASPDLFSEDLLFDSDFDRSDASSRFVRSPGSGELDVESLLQGQLHDLCSFIPDRLLTLRTSHDFVKSVSLPSFFQTPGDHNNSDREVQEWCGPTTLGYELQTSIASHDGLWRSPGSTYGCG